MLRNRFLAEDEEASAESAEAAESVETEEESVEAPSEDGDNKKSRKKSSSSAPEERECEIGEYMRQISTAMEINATNNSNVALCCSMTSF